MATSDEIQDLIDAYVHEYGEIPSQREVDAMVLAAGRAIVAVTETEIAAEDKRLKAAHARNERVEKKAAAANKECEALRKEARNLRYSNYLMQGFMDDPSTQMGYKRRYEKLVEEVQMARAILSIELNGLPEEKPKTLEPWNPPKWMR